MKSLHDIAHSLLRGALGITARMPLGALYVFSDLAAPVVRHVARYRLRVVRDNLAKCFPDMAEKDRRAIEKNFYRNFTDCGRNSQAPPHNGRGDGAPHDLRGP